MEEELNRLLREGTLSARRRGWRCFDDLQLAAYVDGTLDANARPSLEAHLTDCKACLRQVSFLMQSSEWPEPTDVPAWLITKAQKLVSEQPKPANVFGRRWVTATLAAGSLLSVLVVFAIWLRTSGPKSDQAQLTAPQPEQKPVAISQPSISARNSDAIASSSASIARGPATKPATSIPLIRNAESENQSLKLLFPHDGDVIKRGSIDFRWRTVSDAVFYEVTIMTASGDTVVSRQTEGKSLSIPADVRLTSGAKYFVSVRAKLIDGKTARSKIVSFRVAD